MLSVEVYVATVAYTIGMASVFGPFLCLLVAWNFWMHERLSERCS